MLKKLSKSFFDDAKPQDSFWEKQDLTLNEAQIEFQCLLFQKSSKTGFWISRNYCIYNQKLVKLKANSDKLCYVNLKLARVELTKYKNSSEKEAQNKKKYGFRIVRNMQYKELFARTKEMNLALWDTLKKYAILVSFKDDFNLQKSIGKGNFAKVYLATRKANKRQYAVKCFEKQKLTNGDTDQRALLKEIDIIRKISHKGIIKVHEVYEDEQHIYIVQDYLEGGELYHHIKKNQQLNEPQVARIIANLLNSIEYLHSQNILHRDLKPENMILRTKGVLDDIVIADFGLADIYDPFGNYMFQRCGTPGFVAPEVLQDRIYDNKIDIFSIGCLMFLLLSGKSPFKGTTYDEVVMRNYHCKVDFPTIENKVSSKAFNLIKAMLHPKPSSRPNCRQALTHPWFQANLDPQKYAEFADAEASRSLQDGKSNQTDINSPEQFMKQFVKPFGSEKPQFSTPQIDALMKIQEKQLLTPQLNKVMDQIQEQIEAEDTRQLVCFDDFTDLQMEEDAPQSHLMPQYQLIGKLKQGIDSKTSSYYASPMLTPQAMQSSGPRLQRKIEEIRNNDTKGEDELDVGSQMNSKIANKVKMNLKNFDI